MKSLPLISVLNPAPLLVFCSQLNQEDIDVGSVVNEVNVRSLNPSGDVLSYSYAHEEASMVRHPGITLGTCSIEYVG